MIERNALGKWDRPHTRASTPGVGGRTATGLSHREVMIRCTDVLRRSSKPHLASPQQIKGR